MSIDNSDIIRDTIKKFLSCIPINKIRLDSLSDLSWENQQYLLNNTIKNNLVLKYPLKTSYQKVFLKSIIDTLEKNNTEVHDEIYETYCNILNCDDAEKYFYKHYVVENNIITLKENKNFISEGTTGLCSWQASYALSEWCILNKNQLKNKSILELGSGIGLLGLTVFKTCKPKLLVLSDCHPTVLQVLNENILLNSGNTKISDVIQQFSADFSDLKVDSFAKSSYEIDHTVKDFAGDSFGNTINFSDNSDNISDISSEKLKEKCSKREISGTNKSIVDFDSSRQTFDSVNSSVKLTSDVLKIISLNWEFVKDNENCENLNPDIILAADVVYDNSVFIPLCETINYFINKNSKTDVIFACTERNSETLYEFLKLLKSNSLKIKSLKTPEANHFYWSTEVPIRLFLVTKEDRRDN